jgi:hypothetical protein
MVRTVNVEEIIEVDRERKAADKVKKVAGRHPCVKIWSQERVGR